MDTENEDGRDSGEEKQQKCDENRGSLHRCVRVATVPTRKINKTRCDEMNRRDYRDEDRPSRAAITDIGKIVHAAENADCEKE